MIKHCLICTLTATLVVRDVIIFYSKLYIITVYRYLIATADFRSSKLLEFDRQIVVPQCNVVDKLCEIIAGI